MRTRLYDVMTSRMPSGDVLPKFSLNNFGYRNHGYAISICQQFVRHVVRCFPNLNNITSTKYSHSVVGTFMVSVSALLSSILIIIRFGSEEKVTGIATDRIITVVTYTNARRDIPTGNGVGKNMSQLVCMAKPNLTILKPSSMRSYSASPRPAFPAASHFNSTPKAWYDVVWYVTPAEAI